MQNEEPIIASQELEEPAPLKEYSPPSIKEWGNVADLTQASANSPTDGFGGSQPP